MPAPHVPDEIRAGWRRGELATRPGPPQHRETAPRPGVGRLGGHAGPGPLLLVPERLPEPAPLVVMLHGAGGEPGGVLPFVQMEAEARGVLVLAPKSGDATWDVIRGGLGPDVRALDTALAEVLDRFAVDPARIVLAGFSDGASYALTLGLANGLLFSHVAAFSPGFIAAPTRVGRPSIFVSHGISDPVLPIDRCSRRLVPVLRDEGYEVDYREFPGLHEVPVDMVRAALDPVAPVLGAARPPR